MKRIPRGYLSRPGGRWRTVRVTELLTLLYNVCQGSREETVGWEDTHRTMEMIMTRLNNRVLLEPSIVESALWSCNLMNEAGKFWDSRGRSFDAFVKDLLGRDRLNLTYNTVETKDDK